MRARRNAEGHAKDTRQQPCAHHEHERTCETLPYHVDDRRVIPKTRAPITHDHALSPQDIPLPKRRARPPVRGELGPLGGAHAQERLLSHVRLNRIDGRSRHERERDEADGNHQRAEPQHLAQSEPPRKAHIQMPHVMPSSTCPRCSPATSRAHGGAAFDGRHPAPRA